MLSRMIVKLFPFCKQSNLTWYGVFKPVYYFTSMFGLFPYSIRYNSTNVFKSKSNCCYLNFMYALTIIIIFCVFSVLHIQDVNDSGKSYNMTDEDLTGVNYICEFLFLVLNCIVAYYCAFVNGNLYISILNRIIATFSRAVVHRPERNIQRVDRRIKYLIYSYAFIVLLPIIINFTRNGSVWKSVLVLFTFILPQAVQLATLVHYCALVVMLTGSLDNLKLCLYEYNQERAKGVWTIQPRGSMTLGTLKHCYIKVYNIKEDINRAFQAPILLTTIQCFHCLVSETFIVYHGGVVSSHFTIHEFINCVTWIAWQLYKIYVLCYSGNLLKVKMGKIGRALCCITTDENGLQQLLEIQNFSTAISSHNLNLSVYGYFFLDATLMYNMVSSVTTYFIILIQLDRGVHSH